MPTPSTLERRFYGLWKRLANVPQLVLERRWKELEHKYTKGRHYHNLEHIYYCLHELDDNRDLALNADAVETAIWYHDLVYHTHECPEGLPGNEALSAKVCDTLLHASGVSLSFRREVARLILATTHTADAELSPDEQLIADIDWSPLGMHWHNFLQASEEIRREYAEYTDEGFRAGRIQFLKSALDRALQYHTGRYRLRFENQARENLRRALRILEQQAG